MSEEDTLIRFLNTHQGEIIDWINNNIKIQFTPTNNIFDRLANQLNQEFPYGQEIDNMHRFLTNAIMCSLWCGWFSQARTNAGDTNFRSEYIDRFRHTIDNAFNIGVRFSNSKP